MKSGNSLSILLTWLSLMFMFSPIGYSETVTWSDGMTIEQTRDSEMVQVADWNGLPERRWAGPGIWTNRLQDWIVKDGFLECVPENDMPCRTAHLLTDDLDDSRTSFALSVDLALSGKTSGDGFVGLLVGAGEGNLDYRGAAIIQNAPGKGGGLLAVLDLDDSPNLAFRDMSAPETELTFPLLYGQTNVKAVGDADVEERPLRLNLEGQPGEDGRYELRLSLWDSASGDLVGACELKDVPESRLKGNVALVSHGNLDEGRHRFDRFTVGGDKFSHHPDRTFGPIAGTLYSLNDSVLKLGVQCMSLGKAVLPPMQKPYREPRMRILIEARPLSEENAEWKIVSEAQAISPPDYYTMFRFDDWDGSRDWETRAVFKDYRGETYSYTTIIRRDPVDKPVVSAAGFACFGVVGRITTEMSRPPREGEILVGRWTPGNVWMPFEKTVAAVKKQDVDILFFTGDQIYEARPTRAFRDREPFEDYLYKWLLWHWSMRELTNHLPSVCQPDDHDVYHGNLWGWGGRLNLSGFNGEGGYLCSPDFVNMVHRTQTGHDPDVAGPALARNGITNYYNSFTYGDIGFAVLEDRKFKTPQQVKNPDNQQLLGPEQEEFLRRWGEDWTGQKFKVVVSQTVYGSLHVNFEGGKSVDHDSGGFPKVGRDRAVELFRRCGAFLLCGDQHLATFTRLGVDGPSDSVYQLCVPAAGNMFWRWFYPNEPGRDRQPSDPDYLGEFLDGYGNYFRMIAVANPERRELLGDKLRRRPIFPIEETLEGKGITKHACQNEGYGVLRLNKINKTITVECWPDEADPETDGQFQGWPQVVNFEDLDGRVPKAWLPDIKIVEGPSDPVVQIIDEKSNDIVKITRAKGGFFRPGVFDPDTTYTIRVGEPSWSSEWWQKSRLTPKDAPGAKSMKVKVK